MSMFTKADKQKAKLRLALTGVSVGGKTYSALVMAKALGGRVALLDSERSSSLLYADKFDFQHADLSNHSIERYREAIKAAAAEGFDVLIIDSLSHEWAGRGGVLEQVDRAKAQNKFTAWNGPSQQHNSLVDDLLLFPGHVIVTMRRKADYVLEEVVRNGQKTQQPKKVGMAVVQREGVEYEFTVLLAMERDGTVLVEKSRCSAIEEKANTLRREDLDGVAATLRDWLASGKDAPPAPAPKTDVDPVDRAKGVARGLFQIATTVDELKAAWSKHVTPMGKADADDLTPDYKAALVRIAAIPNPAASAA